MAKSSAVIQPNLGLYFDRPAIAMGRGMLQAGFNFRVKEGALSNLNLGWNRFSDFTLNGPVTLIDTFYLRGGSSILILGTTTDLYQYDSATDDIAYITPIYDTGTAEANGTAVTGVGTNWDPEAKAGDQIHFGDADYTDPSGTWFTILSRTNDTTLTLTASAGVIAAGPYTIRKRFTGDINDQWVFDTFINAEVSGEDEWWATNGVDDVIKWNGTDDQVEPQTALNFKCKYLVVYRNMMIFANLNQGGTLLPNEIINSDLNEPSDVSTGLSEQFRVHSGTGGDILSARPIGDALAIYSERTVTLAQFVGDPLVFTFRNAMSDVGVVAAKAVADYGDYHEFIGQDSYYRFDGATVREVNQHVWRDVIREQDPTRITRAYSHFDEEQGDLIWSVPSTVDPQAGDEEGAPSQATTVHYLETVPPNVPQPHSQRAWPFTATGYYFRNDGITWDTLTQTWDQYNFRWNDQFFFSAFPLNMGGDANGKVYTISTSQDADGAGLVSFVRFGRAATGDGRTRNLIARLYPFVSPFVTPLNITVRLSDHAMGVVTITHEVSFDQSLPEGGHFAAIYRRGRFYELEYGSDGPAQPWELSGYDLDVRTGGMR